MTSRTRVRLLAVAILLVGLAFIQDPGFLVSDTKFDLAAAPAHFLERALHLWDGQGAFGQLQNQAYGYLWPMGPFFALFHALDVQGWVIQRLWWALVMVVAFLGVAKVTRALGVRSDLACIAAGLAYALSPRMLTVLGPSSIEVWPSALAPWVLLPLIAGSVAGSPRRAAALSALAVAMVGGVNAAATFAVIPLGAVWLLTRSAGPRRRRLMLWWPLFVLLASMWWLVPLFVLGSYSPPFLDYIETTSITTFPTTVFDALRGTSNWIPYVDSGSRAGNDLLTLGFLGLNSAVVVFVGLAGLLDRRTPHRTFLVLGAVVGLVMVTAGHTGAVEGWASGDVRSLLDGVLAPLRNVHKFDPIIRLPLVVGLAFVVDRALASRPQIEARPPSLQRSLDLFSRVTLIATTLMVIAGAAAPAATARIAPASPLLGVPPYWGQAASWLADHDQGGRALLVPGSPFGEYIWGSPKDEPMQYMARSPWAVRNVIPLAPAGNIRMLDEIEERLAQGQGSAGLTAYLRRAGISHLVVRNDLRRGSDIPDQVLVHQALAQSPGLDRVATFGPDTGGGAHLDTDSGRVVINQGWQSLHPAVEIFSVAGPAGLATSAERPTVVAGGPEDLLDLADLGLLGQAPTVLAADAGKNTDLVGGDAGPPLVLTDGLRRRERFFGRIHDGYSAVTTPGDRSRTGNPVPDYAIENQSRWSTKARLEGAASVSASSSGADADTPGGTRRAELPYAALDGSEETSWISAPGRSGHAWWRLAFTRARSLPSITVTGGAEAPLNQKVRVRTDTGVDEVVALVSGQEQTIDLGPRPLRWLRLSDGAASPSIKLSLAEVSAPGLDVVRRLQLPTLPDAWGLPDTIVLRPDLDSRTGCAVVDNDVRCAARQGRASEEGVQASRGLDLAQQGEYDASLVARPRPGRELDALVMQDQPVSITASTTGFEDARAAARAAIDGDPRTTWIADLRDDQPLLSVNWLGRKPVSGLSLSTDQNVAARRPTRMQLTWPGGSREVRLDADGKVSFPAILTDQLQLRVKTTEDAASIDFSAQRATIPVGVSELRITGVPYLPVSLPTQPRAYPCGTGPEVEVNGLAHQTRVTASPAALASGASVPVAMCALAPSPAGQVPTDGALTLRAGANDVTMRHSPALLLESLVLRRRGADPDTAAAPAGGAVAEQASADSFRVQPGADDAVVGLRENANPGWVARQDGHDLTPVTLDGWQQGWVLKEPGEVVLGSFGPQRTYLWGMALGALCLLGLFAGLLRRRDRTDRAPGLGDGRLWWPAVLVLAAGVGAWTAAAGGVLVAVLAVAVVAAASSRWPDEAPWMVASPCLVVGLAYFALPWANASGWAGSERWATYLMLVPVAGLLASVAAGRPRFLHRFAGSSTNR